MGSYTELLELLNQAIDKLGDDRQECKRVAYDRNNIPVGVSNRHIHLSKEDLDRIFGVGYQLTPIKELSQPGQFACNETVTLCGPRGSIERVRVLGPTRAETQIEVLMSDCFKLGIPAEVRMSGDLDGTPGLTVVGVKGSIQLNRGAIVAQRHIHMHTLEAKELGFINGQKVSIRIDGHRGGVLDNLIVRVSDSAALDCHIDIEEGNAMMVSEKTKVSII